jgi:hypothetical protein
MIVLVIYEKQNALEIKCADIVGTQTQALEISTQVPLSAHYLSTQHLQC